MVHTQQGIIKKRKILEAQACYRSPPRGRHQVFPIDIPKS